MTNLEHTDPTENKPELERSPDSEAPKPPTEITVIPNEIALNALAAKPPADRQNTEAALRLRAK